MRGSKAILWMSLALAACGKSSTLTDASGADANRTDAANTIDADAHGPVTVITMNPDGASGPLMGVPVVFQEPNGDLAAEVMTDAMGKATADVLPGATVTALYVISDTQHNLETVTGVKPGDTITIGDAYDATPDGSFTVNVIDVVGTQRYDVYGPCGSGSYTPPSPIAGTQSPRGVIATDPVVIDLQKGCETANMDLVAVRIVGGEPTDFAELSAVPYVSGGSATQQNAWTPVVNLALSFNDITSDVTYVQVADTVPDDWGFYAYLSPAITGTSATTATIVPQAHTALLATTMAGPHSGEQAVYEMVDGTQTSYALDVGTSLLPWIDAPMFDPATAKITTPTTGTGGDAFMASVSYQRPAASGSGSGSATAPTTYNWTVWAAAIGDLTLPTLPTDVADNDPLATDTFNGASALVFDLDLATGYDAVRPYLDSGRDAYYNGRGQLGKLRTSYTWSTLGRAPGGVSRARATHGPRIHVAHSSAAAR